MKHAGIALLALAVIVMIFTGCEEQVTISAPAPQAYTFDETTNLPEAAYGPLWVNRADPMQQAAALQRINDMLPFAAGDDKGLVVSTWFYGIRVNGTEPDPNDSLQRAGTMGKTGPARMRRVYFFLGEHADSLGFSFEPHAVAIACHDYWVNRR